MRAIPCIERGWEWRWMPTRCAGVPTRCSKNAVAAGDVPGVVAAVTTRDATIYEAAFGERVLGQGPAMTADTVMWIASMTKPVTGVAAMQLVEQGRMSLDEPAAKVIPSLGEVKVLEGWDAQGKPRLREAKGVITLRKLLTHTSGFVYDIWNAEMNRYLNVMELPRAGSGKNIALTTPLAFDPGARWEYGIGIDWAGKMVEAVSGQRLGAYIKQHIFDPLGMDSTAYRITPSMRERLAKVHQRGEDGGLAVTEFRSEPGTRVRARRRRPVFDRRRLPALHAHDPQRGKRKRRQTAPAPRDSRAHVEERHGRTARGEAVGGAPGAVLRCGILRRHPENLGPDFHDQRGRRAHRAAARAASRGRAWPTPISGSTRKTASRACTWRRCCRSSIRRRSRSSTLSRKASTTPWAERRVSSFPRGAWPPA